MLLQHHHRHHTLNIKPFITSLKYNKKEKEEEEGEIMHIFIYLKPNRNSKYNKY